MFFVFSHNIIQQLTYTIESLIEESFGTKFFKQIQIISSISDKIQYMNKLLTNANKDLSLKVPALIVSIQDISLYDQNPNNKNFWINQRANLNGGIFYYPFVYNKTKDQAIVGNLQYYSMTFNVNIITESEFLSIDIFKYLTARFPVNIPQQLENLNTYIRIPNSLLTTLVNEFSWDLDNDEIYYLYKRSEDLTGTNTTYFLPYIMNPLIINQGIQRQQKQNLSNDITSKNTLTFEVRFYLPITLFIYQNRKPIKTIDIVFNEDTSDYDLMKNGGIVNLSVITDLNKQLNYISSYLISNNELSQDSNNANIYYITIKLSPRDLQLINQLNDINNQLIIIIPVEYDKYITNNSHYSGKKLITNISLDNTNNTLTLTIDSSIDKNLFTLLRDSLNNRFLKPLFIYTR